MNKLHHIFFFSVWSLGEQNSRLSYYDGLIQLNYSNGTPYNNEEHTPRSTLISFLCDPQIGPGNPEFQVNPPYLFVRLFKQCLTYFVSPVWFVYKHRFVKIFVQIEDKYTYNFRWYTSYACPERPHECLVTDPDTLEQYDLSR